ADPLLRADHRHDLGLGVELDAEPAAVPRRHRPTELGRAVVARIPVRRGIEHRLAHRLDDVLGRRQVRVAHAERDHVDTLRTLRREFAVELGEQVRRQRLDAFGDPQPETASSHDGSRTPSATRTAGPVSRTSSPSSRSIRRTPPGKRAGAFAGTRPASFAATTAAHAPVPHANVSPAPRSQTRTFTPSPWTATNSTFVRSGKRSSCSTIGPIRWTSTSSGSSSTNRTRCGLPIDSAVAL